jgi:NAD dependent epimerase/dehydratase family enzyme
LGRQLHRPVVLPAPAFALRLVLGEMADEALLKSTRVMPAKLLEAGFQFKCSTLDEALAVALR